MKQLSVSHYHLALMPLNFYTTDADAALYGVDWDAPSISDDDAQTVVSTTDHQSSLSTGLSIIAAMCQSRY